MFEKVCHILTNLHRLNFWKENSHNKYSIEKASSENLPSQISFDFSKNGVENSKLGNIEFGILYRNKPCDSIYMENLIGLIFPSENNLNKNFGTSIKIEYRNNILS